MWTILCLWDACAGIRRPEIGAATKQWHFTVSSLWMCWIHRYGELNYANGAADAPCSLRLYHAFSHIPESCSHFVRIAGLFLNLIRTDFFVWAPDREAERTGVFVNNNAWRKFSAAPSSHWARSKQMGPPPQPWWFHKLIAYYVAHWGEITVYFLIWLASCFTYLKISSGVLWMLEFAVQICLFWATQNT